MAAKNAILQMKIEEVLNDLLPKTIAAQVIVDDGTQETLATRLASIMSKLDGIVDSGTIDSKISTAIDGLIDGAPGTYDTLKEIADYIASHEEVSSALNEAIGNKVDKVEGKGLSTEDFTTALKTKLEGIAEGATKVEASTNGNIKINGSDTPVYVHPTGAGNNHLPAGGTVGQVLRASGNGAATWGENVRSGASEPGDLAAGELFIKIIA